MTRNEAANIVACLESVRDFPNIYVVDSQSQDQTCALVAQFNAQIVPFVWDRCYPRKKEWCRRHVGTAQPWLFYLDADERMTPKLARAIDDALATDASKAGFYVRSKMVWHGKELCFGARYKKIALIRRDAVMFPDIRDHDASGDWAVEGHVQPMVSGGVGVLPGFLRHEDAKGMTAWFDRHNRYSDWEAALSSAQRHQMLATESWCRRWLKQLRLRVPGWPLWRFIGDYVLLLGMLDGRAGFDHAVARAFYVWQIGLKRRAHNARKSGMSGGSGG